MINSAVTSRLGYCNSLLYSINGYVVPQLQRCQNNAACIVSVWRKYDQITPVLKDLHWLPVEQRINYEILLLTYKAQHGMALAYLSSLLSPYRPGRSLRSECKHFFTTPCYRLEGFGKRGTPSLRNTPPSPSSVSSPLTLSRVVWRHISLMSHIHKATWHFYNIVCIFPASVWCLSDIISAFWAWRLLALEINAMENWHYYYHK